MREIVGGVGFRLICFRRVSLVKNGFCGRNNILWGLKSVSICIEFVEFIEIGILRFLEKVTVFRFFFLINKVGILYLRYSSLG